MERFFNTAGPGKEKLNYMVDPLRRIDYEEILSLIRKERYFVLHAPRQTGKTTSLLAMVKRLNADGEFACVYVNVEAAQTARNDVTAGIRTVISGLGRAVDRFLDDGTRLVRNFDRFDKMIAEDALAAMLTDVCVSLDKPLVLFIDEIDALIGDTLVSVLRQLRTGYADRPEYFPVSVILCGIRDIRDYRIQRSDGEIITGGSCFNIKAKSLRLGDFSIEDIRELYGQHTADTGQVFEEEIYPEVWELTHGQPWLVNALAYELTDEMPEGKTRTNPITLRMVEEAADRLIIARATHLDQLVDKLNEPRVRRVIAPMLAGDDWDDDPATKPAPDDLQYVMDLGLVRIEDKQTIISNGIYREVIPRELTYITQLNMPNITDTPWYLDVDGSMDIPVLLRGFQQFFRENAGSWTQAFDYHERGFQLLLQAYLQRIINGGGQLEREYALGSGRVDLLVRYRYPQDVPRDRQKEQRVVIELKTVRRKPAGTGSQKSPEAVLEEGLAQTYRYSLVSNAQGRHLVICDEREGKDWDEKIYERVELYQDVEIGVWGV